MEDLGSSGFSGLSTLMKKRRSAMSRRPRLDSPILLESCDPSPPSSTPSSDNASKPSTDGSSDHDGSIRKKEFSLNSLIPKVSSINRNTAASAPKKIRKDAKFLAEFDEIYGNDSSRAGSPSEHGQNSSDLRRCREGVLAPSNLKNNSKVRETPDMQSRSPDSHVGNGRNADGRILGQSGGTSNRSTENKLKKVKLKVGGVTRTIHAKSNVESGSEGGSFAKPPRPSDAPLHRQKLIVQDNSDDGHSPPEKANGLQGVPRKHFRGESFPSVSKGSLRDKATEGSASAKQRHKVHNLLTSEAVRKSKRVPKRRVLDGIFDDEDEDDEIRYLERLKSSKLIEDQSVEHENMGMEGVKKQKISKVPKRASYEEDDDFSLSRRSREGRKRSRSGRATEGTDYPEEEEPGSDGRLDDERKKQKKESLDFLTDVRKETSLTTRQRALQSGKDGSGANGASLIEFPDGLPPAPPRKQKEKLSEVEKQLKKAEAAQRRKLQVEKTIKESEAGAIRKILGQDSSRKKREEKLRKKHVELAQERAAKSLVLSSETVRWVMGPSGTTVTFSDDIGLPSIFNPRPCSYPPPREKCAGPSCSNVYKYRDSKSNLPLCSLQCYRAVQKCLRPVTTC